MYRAVSPLTRLFLLLAVLLLCLAQSAVAASPHQWMAGAGARFNTSPYKSYTSWSPTPVLGYEGEYFYIRGLQAGFKLYSADWLELSVFAAYDPTSFHSNDTENSQLKRLDDRYESAQAGLAARIRLPMGTLHAKAAADVLNANGGFTAEVGYSHTWLWGRVQVSPSAGLRWYSRQYQDYYYGVSATEAARSGLRSYSPADGLDPYVGLRLGYAITEQWNAMLGVDAAFLNEQLQSSPMTDKGMRFTSYLAVVYLF